MAFCLARQRTSAGSLYARQWAAHTQRVAGSAPLLRRNLFSFLRREQPHKKPQPILSEDDLFHPFSKSPFPALKGRGEAIQSLASCPVCPTSHTHSEGEHAHVKVQPKSVAFECPDCGFPTHCSEEHWEADEEHAKYCSRLREVNEDEHDLRSGREMHEFKLPGPQGYEEAVSFSNWDVFWYTRGFPSMDTERARRHASKLLTYPLTIGSVLHQNSSLTLNNQRVTSEGSRSLAALRSTLHVPPGAPDTEEAGVSKPQIRIFCLGARAESSLPPNAWEQLTMLFPSCHFHLFFIGPQVSLPKPPGSTTPGSSSQSGSTSGSSTQESASASSSSEPASSTAETTSEVTDTKTEEATKQAYVPNIYEPPTPAPIARLKRTRSSLELYGVPSYTVPFTPQLTITGMQANYADVHAQFEGTFDPYCDVFFLFSPGFGFPSPESKSELDSQPLLQIASPTEWGPVIPALLQTRCPIFMTGFSPADLERDVRSIETAPEVAGEFDWLVTPGQNPFGSEKWEAADFDPRVMIRTNWGVWGIRGKGREVRDSRMFSGLGLF
ncbi:hypothetical protein CONPUDRAFT_162622 [Coniophora puteana RWD-64-598 SS2]|uniref:Uncharacterized protein n=1 Tax=Coniophora puteana (strain RWD-64-598) TaxID=741705 RepID=A0A5M3N211_CONPW|nr:uncharacterized protein CONPUDRAFT_162622 [Coniophora puteana RWD-64-598 SS2]EIW85423.1 hypothetical protein CONPUDRAFT_162622 [Coniophora puteana RWD-64-598 SS2]